MSKKPMTEIDKARLGCIVDVAVIIVMAFIFMHEDMYLHSLPHMTTSTVVRTHALFSAGLRLLSIVVGVGFTIMFYIDISRLEDTN